MEQDNAELRRLLNKGYEDFVKELGEMAGDSKVLAAITAGKRDGAMNDERVMFKKITIPVHRLRPTQNEIDVDKSLKYQLKTVIPGQLKGILEGKDVMINAPLVVLNGKYIIDGHHRWSQIYAMNPNAMVVVLDMESEEKPLTILKAVQLAIAAELKTVPIAHTAGSNLLLINEEELKKYVVSLVSEEALSLLTEYRKIAEPSKDAAAEYVWSNILLIRKTSQPIPGAPDRDFMPQTDDAKDWKDMLSTGIINFKEPVAHESRFVKTFESATKDTKKMGIKKFDEFFESEGYDSPQNAEDLNAQFDHMGYDDDSVLVGNCKYCGSNGVDVMAHEKECTKEKPYARA